MAELEIDRNDPQGHRIVTVDLHNTPEPESVSQFNYSSDENDFDFNEVSGHKINAIHGWSFWTLSISDAHTKCMVSKITGCMNPSKITG